MVDRARRHLIAVLLGAFLASSSASACAQAPLHGTEAPGSSFVRFPLTESFARDEGDEEIPAPTPSTAAGQEEGPGFLKLLPQPPDEPRSLFDPAPPISPSVDLERPYFEYDPILDPPQWGRPGWFTNVDVALIKPHVSNETVEAVTTGLGSVFTVQLGSARLDWTVAPRLEAGYRLPSGFGEISLSDRFFVTQGSGPFGGPDGPATRTTHFNVNFSDLDYGSREYTPFSNWSLRFRGGLRAAQTYFNSRVDQPFAQAAAGSTLFSQGETNRTTAFGPHFGVEAQRRLAWRGLTLVTSADVADLFTRVRQSFFVTTTVPAPGGGFVSGSSVTQFLQDVPVVSVQFGLSWRPPSRPNSRLYLGYMGQFWYQFATNSQNGFGPFLQPIPTHFDTESVVFQWSRNY